MGLRTPALLFFPLSACVVFYTIWCVSSDSSVAFIPLCWHGLGGSLSWKSFFGPSGLPPSSERSRIAVRACAASVIRIRIVCVVFSVILFDR